MIKSLLSLFLLSSLLRFWFQFLPLKLKNYSSISWKQRSNSSELISQRTTMAEPKHNLNWWLRVAIYTIFLISGTVTAVLLTRLYYEKGGKSIWLGTLVQVIGFPVLFPFYFCMSEPKLSSMAAGAGSPNSTKQPSLRMLFAVYMFFGILLAGSSYLYSIGFEYLPASTLCLISPSQLAFNACLSYFLNSQKFTPFILNSILLLTISSILLVANDNMDKPAGVSKRQYATGFISTVFGAAIVGLGFAAQQLTFRKFLKKQSVKVVLDLVVYQSLVASIFILIGFLAAGDYKHMKAEMEGFELGKASYIMTLTWAAIAYQIFTLGAIALVFEASALFSNVVALLGVPITPIVAMIVFHDRMDGIKGISMVLAVWGTISYIYQHHLDDRKLKTEISNGGSAAVSEA